MITIMIISNCDDWAQPFSRSCFGTAVFEPVDLAPEILVWSRVYIDFLPTTLKFQFVVRFAGFTRNVAESIMCNYSLTMFP